MELTTLQAVFIGAAPFVLLIGVATIFIGNKKKTKNRLKSRGLDSKNCRNNRSADMWLCIVACEYKQRGNPLYDLL